jgi:geranylgeranyl diphosphate synthase, type II
VIDDHVTHLRLCVDRALAEWMPSEDVAPERLHAAMRYSIFGGGKRLRPVCCLLAAEAVGGAAEAALPAAAALELIHTYSLVHDDLPCMDDDDYRRGRLTVHKVYGDAMGVLAGDALLTLAFEIVAEQLPPAVATRVAVALARGAGSSGMVGGQVGDLDAEGRVLEVDEILAIDRRKTAALFAASFEAGALCANAAPEHVAALTRLGDHLGVAFQIVDDLLDVSASPATMGKATGKDVARGKATLPSRLGIESARAVAREHSAAATAIAVTLPQGRLIEALIGTMLERSS